MSRRGCDKRLGVHGFLCRLLHTCYWVTEFAYCIIAHGFGDLKQHWRCEATMGSGAGAQGRSGTLTAAWFERLEQLPASCLICDTIPYSVRLASCLHRHRKHLSGTLPHTCLSEALQCSIKPSAASTGYCSTVMQSSAAAGSVAYPSH